MRDEVREFKRDRILAETLRLFCARGFQGASIDAIAESLNVTKPFIYTYFQNKHALLEALYERVAVSLNSGVDKIMNSGLPPDEMLRQLVEFYVRENVENRELTVIFLNEERNLSAERLAELLEQNRSFDHKLTNLIREGVRTGVFVVEDCSVASMSISGMVRWVHRWFNPAGRLEADDLCRQMSTLALNLVGHSQAVPQKSRRSTRSVSTCPKY
jgi:AcrR family transcriptional regulator